MHLCRNRTLSLIAGLLAAHAAATGAALDFPGPAPGPATARLEPGRVVLENAVLTVAWDVAPDRFALAEVVNRMTGETGRPRPAEPFAIRLAGGQAIKASDLKREAEPSLERIEPDADSIALAPRDGGWRARLPLVSRDGRIRVDWQASLRDGANAVDQRVTVTAVKSDVPIEEMTLIDLDLPEAEVVGSVDGSPVVTPSLFVACEHPMASHRVEGGAVRGSVPRYRPVRPDRPWSVTSAIGAFPAGQLRRAFVYDLERRRARPYSPLVYYISWFDIAAPDRKMTEALCLDRIHHVGRELAKRGVKLDAFVFDDGWDDNRTLWECHDGFPRGFAPLRTTAAEYGAVLGTWISPWGGYGRAKAERLEFGKSQGFETNPHGFSLDGPNYYSRFVSVCVRHAKEFGVEYFKFDGVGPGNVSTGAGAEYGPDIEALLTLIGDLRAIQPRLFVNTTVGTWPSPYWLCYADSIWRSGHDVGFEGPGTTRQQWLTYRDMIGYQLRTRRGPLYPLNSLKFQSFMCAPLSLAGKISNDPSDLVDDLRMAAASGTQMQEFFITPDMIAPEIWDAMAATIRWTRQNADVLVDTHGLGGDPGAGEPYGYASWSPRKAIVALRNPSDRPASIDIDLQAVLELPEGAARCYSPRSPWEQPIGRRLPDAIEAGRPWKVELAPFEVAVVELLPVESAGESAAAEAIRRAAGREIDAGLFPGAVVLVGTPDKVLYHEAFGHARLVPDKVAMRKDHIFGLASVTKVVATGTAYGVAVDDGLLEFDAPIGSVLSEMKGEGVEAITARHLATHTSGLSNQKYHDRARGDEMLQRMLTATPQWPVDTRYEYACLNAILLGRMIEQTSGRRLDEFCRTRIFEPLGMVDTAFGPLPASPRVVPSGAPRIGQIEDGQARAAGRPVGNAGLFSTAADLARFSEMMLGRGSRHGVRILSESTHASMTRNLLRAPLPARGFCWEMNPRASHRPTRLSEAAYGHSGHTGQSIWIDPQKSVYVIVLTNRNHPEMGVGEKKRRQYEARSRIGDAALEALGY